jgi:hypothetical protein
MIVGAKKRFKNVVEKSETHTGANILGEYRPPSFCARIDCCVAV